METPELLLVTEGRTFSAEASVSLAALCVPQGSGIIPEPLMQPNLG